MPQQIEHTHACTFSSAAQHIHFQVHLGVDAAKKLVDTADRAHTASTRQSHWEGGSKKDPNDGGAAAGITCGDVERVRVNVLRRKMVRKG